MRCKFLLVCSLSLLLAEVDGDSDPTESSRPSVRTSTGTYIGYREEVAGGKQLDVFLGVPYAQPPVGNLRFRRPVPLEPSNATLITTSQPKSCYQKYTPLSNVHPALKPLRPQTDLSEDCLYLNVWSPKGSALPLPVMAFIHGGGFSRGSVATTAHEAKNLAASQNVIVVMFNYRVGSLGFLFLDHPEAPGNDGLFDQLLALEWIQKNIGLFGGDPGSVTLFGQSAGAASVAYHLLSPKSWPFFHRAIIQSGSPMSFWAYNTRKLAMDYSEKLVANVGCPGVNGSDATGTLDCLRNADPETLIFNEPQGLYDMVYMFRPIVDHDFLDEDQLKMFKKGKFKKADVMLGTNRDEGSAFLVSFDPILFPLTDHLNVQIHNVNELGQRLVGYGETIAEVVQILYYDPNAPEVSLTYARYVSQGFSDFLFHCPVNQVASAVVESGSKVFKYYFTHRSSNSKWPKWMGTVHGEELSYVFGHPLDDHLGFSEGERELSLRMMKYWANFARTGNPNKCPEGEEEVLSVWPEHSADQQEYLVLAPNSTQVGNRLRAKACNFWTNFFDFIDSKDNTSKTLQRCCS